MVPSVGVLWSAVASVRAGAPAARPAAGRRRPAARSPRGPGAGRCRSSPRRPRGPARSFEHVLRHPGLLFSQAGGYHRQEARRLLAFVLEMMGKIGVEGDAVAAGKVVAGPSTRGARVPSRTTAVSRLPGSCIGGSSRPPVEAPGPGCARRRRRAARAAAASAPRSGAPRARSGGARRRG